MKLQVSCFLTQPFPSQLASPFTSLVFLAEHFHEAKRKN